MNFDQDLLAIDEEQFVLLCAYMDGEATAAETAQVEQWLTDDAAFARVYEQQQQIQKLLIDLPVPTATTDAFGQRQDNTELVIAGVMKELDRQAQRRRWLFGGVGLVAATLIGAVASVFTVPSSPQFSPVANQVDSQTAPANGKEDKLIIAMEDPLVPMPKDMK